MEYKRVQRIIQETHRHTGLLQVCKSVEIIVWCTVCCRPPAVRKYKNLQYHSEPVASFPSFASPPLSPPSVARAQSLGVLLRSQDVFFLIRAAGFVGKMKWLLTLLLIKFVYIVDHGGFTGSVSRTPLWGSPAFTKTKPAKPAQLLCYLEKSVWTFIMYASFFLFKKNRTETHKSAAWRKIAVGFILRPGSYCTQTHSGSAASRIRAALYPSDYTQEHQTHSDFAIT